MYVPCIHPSTIIRTYHLSLCLYIYISTAGLTAFTLFFEELVPKALAVSNSELVARKLVPIISRMSSALLPITSAVTVLNDFVLGVVGLRSKEDQSVSEDMLRMVVDEAQRSDEGIETEEGRMINAVLDMQDVVVNKIMQPRVDIVALPVEATASAMLRMAVQTKYSRIPVFRGDIDNIVGVVLCKDLLSYMSLPETNALPLTSSTLSSSANGDNDDSFRPQMKENWNKLTVMDFLEPTYYIPEAMSCWVALQVL